MERGRQTQEAAANPVEEQPERQKACRTTAGQKQGPDTRRSPVPAGRERFQAEGANDALAVFRHAFPAEVAAAIRAARRGFAPTVIKAAFLDDRISKSVQPLFSPSPSGNGGGTI